MIRITLHQAASELVLKVEGALAGDSVAELEACWIDARQRTRVRRLKVDLRDVSGVDDRGRALMRRMFVDGARFVASGCEMPEVVREIARPHRDPFIERI